MKRMLSCFLLIPALLCVLLIAGCGRNSVTRDIKAISGLDLSGCKVISSEDTHGGWLGDGTTAIQFDCTQVIDSVLQQTEGWRNMPLSENLRRIMYEGNGLAKECGIPTVANGRYFFLDRQAETDIYSDRNLFSRPSFNFTLLILDTDSSQLYYLKFDT